MSAETIVPRFGILFCIEFVMKKGSNWKKVSVFPKLIAKTKSTLPRNVEKKTTFEESLQKMQSSESVAAVKRTFHQASDTARDVYKKTSKTLSETANWVSNAGKETASKAAAAIASRFAVIMPTVDTTIKVSIMCLLIVIVPVFFVMYMLTKLQSNCNIAWVLSWSKIHPCWVDLGPHGNDWEFPPHSGTGLAHSAYTHCSIVNSTQC